MRIRARPISPRSQAELHLLTDVPVLTVRQIPEGKCIVRVETRLCHRVGMKQPIAHDFRPANPAWQEHVRHHVVGVAAQQQVRQNRIEIDVAALLARRSGKHARRSTPSNDIVPIPSRNRIRPPRKFGRVGSFSPLR